MDPKTWDELQHATCLSDIWGFSFAYTKAKVKFWEKILEKH